MAAAAAPTAGRGRLAQKRPRPDDDGIRMSELYPALKHMRTSFLGALPHDMRCGHVA